MDTKKEIIRFFAAGTVVITVDFSGYYFLIHVLPFGISKGLSFIVAGIVGYLLNKYWIFQTARRMHGEVGRYILANLSALGINVVTNQCILGIWPGSVRAAFVIATIVTSVMTFACLKWWVFRTALKNRGVICGCDGCHGDF